MMRVQVITMDLRMVSSRPDIPSSLDDSAAVMWEQLLVLTDLNTGHQHQTTPGESVGATVILELYKNRRIALGHRK